MNTMKSLLSYRPSAPGTPPVPAHVGRWQVREEESDTGGELPHASLGKTGGSMESGAESGALNGAEPVDPGLAVVVASGQELPEVLSAGIVAMVRGAGGKGA